MSTACCERAEERELTAQELVEDLSRRRVAEQVELLGSIGAHRTQEFVAEYLAYAQKLRYEQPRDAVRVLSSLIDVIPTVAGTLHERAGLYCRTVGLFASAHRISGHYDVASRALAAVLRLSHQLGLKRETGSLLIKAATVLLEEGEYQDAFELADEAVAAYADTGDVCLVARAVVDRAVIGHYLRRDEEGFVALQSALDVLPDSEREHRCTAYCALAGIYEDRNQLAEASACLGEAARLVEGSYKRALLTWQRGELALTQGELSLSEKLLREARSWLGDANPFDAALVSVDLVKVLFGLGRLAEATEIAKQMAALLSSKARQSAVFTAAIMSLTRDALSGTLSLAAIEKTRSRLKTARNS